MKRKLLFVFSMTAMLVCLLALSVSAEVTEYDDFGSRTKVPASLDDLAVFDDGFVCPAAYITKDQSLFATTFTYINSKTGKDYTIANVVELDIPEGVTEIYQYQFTKNTTLKKCSIPASVTKLQQCIFQQATGLEELVFEHTESSELDHFPNWMVWGCTSLKAFSMPDCITKMTGVAQFTGCKNMTALYLSKNLENINSGAQTTASFADCTNMYFVNEPFTYDAIPEKPSVYYFPKNLTSLPSGGEVFKNCASLNDVLVFPTGVTEIANGWAFCGTNAISIVFLGDMEKVSTTGNAWNKGITLYFCNENDLSADSLTMNTGATKVFCNAEGNTAHLKELSMSTEATCEMPKMLADYCFCGSIVGTPQTEGEALGHNYSGDVTYDFVSLTEGGTKCTSCLNNCGKPQIEALPAVYVELGYSVKTFGEGGFSFTSGYEVNTDMLKLYKEQKGVELKFGMAFNSAEAFTQGEEVTLDSFKFVAPVASENNGVMFSYHDYVISYKDDTNLDRDLIIAAYVIEVNANEEESLIFINRGQGEINGFAPISYNKALELAE